MSRRIVDPSLALDSSVKTQLEMVFVSSLEVRSFSSDFGGSPRFACRASFRVRVARGGSGVALAP